VRGPRVELEALKAPKGVGCGEGVSPPHRGRDLGSPLPRKFFPM